MIRRKARDVERFVGMDLFLREIDRRGFQVAENAAQMVIFCNRAPVRWLTQPDHPVSSKEIGRKSFQDFRSTGPALGPAPTQIAPYPLS